MVQWFKNLFRRKKVETPRIIGIDINHLDADLSRVWDILYESRSDEAYELLLGQIERLKSIETLRAAHLPLSEKTALVYAKQQGKVEILQHFVDLVRTNMKQIDIRRKTKGKVKQGESKTIGTKRRSRPVSPALF